MSRRPPLPPELLSADGKHFYDLLNDAQDVSIIVVGVSYIDACLSSLLATRLRKSRVTEKLLDSNSGPLGTFSARSSLAYALELINKPIYQDLQVLGELRNEVAHHHFELRFASPTISAYCERLAYASGLKNGATEVPLLSNDLLNKPRNRFTITAVLLTQHLLLKAIGANNAVKELASNSESKGSASNISDDSH